MLVQGLPPEAMFHRMRAAAAQRDDPEEGEIEVDEERPQRRVETDPRVIAAFFAKNISRAG